MTRKDIIKLVREAGWSGIYTQWREPDGSPDWKPVKDSLTVPVTMEQIECFAALIASRVAAAAKAEEREECARIAEEPSSQAYDVLVVAGEFRTENNIRLPKHSHDIAKEIRARGQA